MTALSERLRDLWELDPRADAVCSDGAWWSWADLAAAADQQAELWGIAGLDADHPLVVVLENRPAIVATILGAVASGRRTRFVNSMQPSEKIAADLAHLSPAVLVVGAATWSRLSAVPDCRVVLLADDNAVSTVSTAAVPERVSAPETPALAGALELFTSGTTGPAKRITLTMRQIESAMASVLAHHGGGRPSDAPPASPGLVATPIAHIGGLWGVLQSLASARRFVLLERFRVETWVDAVREHRPKATGLPPAALRMVYDADVPREHLESLKALNAGTAPLDPDLVDGFHERYGIPILNVYGATEFAGAVAGWSLPLWREWWDRKRGSVGKPQPGIQLRVVDAERVEVAPGAPGLLQIRGGQTGDDDWVATTDRARIDADGFLWIDGRADDIIIRGGFKVDPVVVRAVLERHPAVAEAAVQPLPDERLGQVPVAAVQVLPGHPAPDVQELRDLCRSALTAYEVPVDFRLVTELPRTAAMKVSAEGVLDLFAREPEPGSVLIG